MYKMVALDLDGTLLTDEGIITPGTIETIQEVMASGVMVTLATGRMFPSAKRFADQLQLDVPIITYQGAVIKDAAKNKIWFEQLLSFDITERLIQIAKEENVHIQVYQEDMLYVTKDNAEIQAYAHGSDVSYAVVEELSSLAERGLAKVLFVGNPSYLDRLQISLKEIFGDCAHIAKSKPNYLEVTHPKANKGSAILYLAEQLGIQQSEIIGMGDNYNDYELLTTAGLGIAMGNGVEALKRVADYITLTNNEEGVRHALNKFILIPLAAQLDLNK